jgi:TolB protein
MDENFLPRQREAEEGRIYVICTGDWLVIRRYMKRGGTVQDELHRIDGFEPNRAGRKHTQLKPETSGRHECNWEFWPIDQDHLHLRTYDTALPLQRMIQAKAEPLDSAKGRQTTEGSSRIAVSVLDEGHGGIYVHNADGSGKKRLTNGSSDILPRWSPDGKQIAFLTLREQDQELAAEHDLAFHWFLYVMDADGQNQRRVTKTPIGMIFQWSPDGTRFVFQSSCEDGANKAKDGTVSSAIYVMKSDGTEQKRLTPFKNNDGFPSWSPDGKQIAFCSNRNGNMDIFVMNADGSDVRRLTTNEANDSVPTWSPGGKQIAFTSFRESGTAFTVNADGTQESSLAVRGRPLAWSPDGHSLLIEKDGQLVLAGADGRNPKELTPEGQPALDGEFSPDGKAVYYRSKVNGTWTLMSVDTERSNQKRIWSDSGKFLGFSVSPSRVSLAKDSMSLPTANTHLTEFGNACRKSEKLYDDSRQQLFGLIPDFLDWKRREIEIPYSSTTNAFEARVIFTPPDGTKAHVAVLVSANRHLVQSKKVDVAEAEPIIVWGPSKVLTEAEYGRYDGHLLKQAAFVLEANLADKDSLDTYLESVDFKRIGKFVTRRIEQQGAPAGKPKSESDSARRETRTE